MRSRDGVRHFKTHCMGSVSPGSLQLSPAQYLGTRWRLNLCLLERYERSCFMFPLLILPCSLQGRFRRVKKLYSKKKKVSFASEIHTAKKIGHIWVWGVTGKWYLKLKIETSCLWEFCLVQPPLSDLHALRQLTRIFVGLCLWGSNWGTSLLLTRWGMVEFCKNALSSGVSSRGAAGCTESQRHYTRYKNTC